MDNEATQFSIAFITTGIVVSIVIMSLSFGISWASGSTHREFMNHLNVVMECRKTVDASKADHICGPVPQWKGYDGESN